MLTVASAAQGTALSVAMDMAEGIMARFRTMAISRASVLTGHVLGSVIQAMLCCAVVTGAALLIGFRPATGPGRWLAAAGLLALASLALTWLSVALGLAAKGVEAASNLPMFLLLLPFLGSGFVPVATMPAGLRASPSTSRSRRSPRRSARCSPAPRRAATRPWPWPGAPPTLLGYLWARHLYRTRPVLTP